MNSTRCRRICLAATGLLLGAGCHHAVVAPPPRVEGTSTFRFVARPPAPPKARPAAEPSEETAPAQSAVRKIRARPIQPLAKPVYPAALLGRVSLPVTVGVRINVDAEGRVTYVGDSFVAISTWGEYAGEFRAAVEEALAQWRFQPAEVRHLVLQDGGPGQGSYWLTTRTQNLDDWFDLSFTFAAKGGVLSERFP